MKSDEIVQGISIAKQNSVAPPAMLELLFNNSHGRNITLDPVDGPHGPAS